MKKLFAVVLAAVMVLGVAASALAAWEAGSPATSKTLADRYTVEIIKFTKRTGSIASYSYEADAAATAVNGADVYWAVRFTVKDVSDPADDVMQALEFSFNLDGLTQASNTAGGAANGISGTIPAAIMQTYGKGVYYLDLNGADPVFSPASVFPANNVQGPIYESRCLDTDVAKVSAKLASKRTLTGGFSWEGYIVAYVPPTDLLPGSITFADGGNSTTFTLAAASSKVINTETFSTSGNAFEANLLAKLGISASALDGGRIYMTTDNLRAAFGWSYKLEPTPVTWRANSTPIILDPLAPILGIGIPKTGDSASVIGFAMIMVAVVAAAVAVRKVNA